MKYTRAQLSGPSRKLLLTALPAALFLFAGTAGAGLVLQSTSPQPRSPQVQGGKPAPKDKAGSQKGQDPVQLPPGIGKTEGARIEYTVGSQNFDFGKMTQGAVATHEFALVAGGTEDLIIKNVKPTCGCTVAQVLIENDEGGFDKYTYGDVVPVGRKIQLPATLHTKNKYGKANTRINIFSNDPRGTIQLGLTADIEAFFTLTPRFLNFGQLKLGETKTQQATITTAGNKQVLLSLLENVKPEGIETLVEALNPDEQGRSSRWQVTVTVGPDLVEGNFARALVLRSDVEIPSAGGDDHDHDHGPNDGHDHGAEDAGHAQEGDAKTSGPASAQGPGAAKPAVTGPNVPKQYFQAQITVSAQVVGPFTYSPNYLSMGLVRPGQVVTRTIRIESHDPEYTFTARELPASLMGLPKPKGEGYQDWNQAQYFSTVVRPVEGKNAVDVELRLEGLPGDAVGSFRGTLLVGLDHPDKKEIALTITGVCRGGPSPGRRVPPRPSGGGR